MNGARTRTVGFVLLIAVLFGKAIAAWGAPASTVLEAEARRIAAMSKAKIAVLAIFAPNGQGGGSGVVVSPDGYAVTNFHVVRPCGTFMQCGMADGRVYDAALVSIDPTGDLALIKLFGRDDFPCAALGDSDRVRTGDWVFAMGNPFLLATDLQPTVTYGIISGVHRYQFPSDTLLEYTDCLQTDASINPGNSGGPLFDAEGHLIGINGRGSFDKRGRVCVGVGYAISINQIKNFLGVLHSGRILDHATLGATVESDHETEGRVVIRDILPNSDAYRRGLRANDEIVSFGGRPITTANGFKNVLGIFPKGWRVPLSYRRDGRRHDILVRLTGVHAERELLEKMGVKEPNEPMPIPKPGEEPKPGSPGKQAKPGEKSPGKGPAKPPRPAQPPVPKIVQQHFKEKRGFANYYFNAINQQRVWKAWNAAAQLAGADGTWTISGTLENGQKFRFEIAKAGALLALPTTNINWTASDELGSSLLPPNSGGLLPALYLWHQLAGKGLGRFGDVYYYGTAPLLGHKELADVLVASYCRFYFDRANGDLLAIEFFSDQDSDPCEIYFSNHRLIDGRRLPGRMDVRYGNDPFATFRLDEFKAEKGTAQNAR